MQQVSLVLHPHESKTFITDELHQVRRHVEPNPVIRNYDFHLTVQKRYSDTKVLGVRMLCGVSQRLLDNATQRLVAGTTQSALVPIHLKTSSRLLCQLAEGKHQPKFVQIRWTQPACQLAEHNEVLRYALTHLICHLGRRMVGSDELLELIYLLSQSKQRLDGFVDLTRQTFAFHFLRGSGQVRSDKL